MKHDDTWQHATECADCRAIRWEKHVPCKVGFGIGESHPEFYKKQNHKKFNKDMDSYRGARKSGLRPETISRQAVETAEKRAHVEEKVMRRI